MRERGSPPTHPVHPQSRLLTGNQAKHLLDLCRAGQLYAVEAWIAAGKSLRMPSRAKVSPLEIAVSTGFHSLVEVLAKNIDDPEELNEALGCAATSQRLDLVRLLVDHGADVRSVPFVVALRSWRPEIMRYFIAKGADLLRGSPFAVAFASKIQTALGPFMAYKQEHPEHNAMLLEQASQALRYFARKGDKRWIRLLLWAGADPRSRGLVVDEQRVRPERYYPNALEMAAYGQTLDALKAFAPDPHRDDLTGMLNRAARSHNDTLISYLLDCGAVANDKENGGFTALDRCMASLDITATHRRLNDLADRFEPVRTSTADRRWIGMCLRIECKELK